MAETRNMQIQDDKGNIYYPQTKASAVFAEDGTNLEGAAIKPNSAVEDNIALFDNKKNTKDSGKGIGNTSGKVLVLPTGLQKGDLLRVNASGQIERLPIGTDGQGLNVSEGLPSWGSSAGGKIVEGTYTGDGSTSRFINVGFTPKIVYIWDNTAASSTSQKFEIFAGDGLVITNKDGNIVSYGQKNMSLTTGYITTNGFVADYTNNAFNTSSKIYKYVAIG